MTAAGVDESGWHRYAVIVAGGSGTRLWPLSRQALPKQMQALMSDKSLITETFDRLRGVVPLSNVYVSTTENYREPIQDLLPDIDRANIIVEPDSRGTAAAFALLAHTLQQVDPQAIVFTLASDHAITEVDRFQQTLRHCYEFIERHPEHLALVGIRPTRADTGLGYIKVRDVVQKDPLVYAAEKFVEKPSHDVALGYVESGEYYWNAAYYCFAASTLLEAYDDADPRLLLAIREYAATRDPAAYLRAPEKVHEIEVIDSGSFPLTVVPADFTWSDIGNWQALHRALQDVSGVSMVSSNSRQHIDVHSTNCLVYTGDDRIVATAGLDNIVVVTTDDVVLVVNMEQVETMPELLRLLHKREMDEYL